MLSSLGRRSRCLARLPIVFSNIMPDLGGLPWSVLLNELRKRRQEGIVFAFISECDA